MKKEYVIAASISLLVIVCVNAPIIFFSLFPKTDLVFLGRRAINSQDMYTYLSFIEQSKQGRWVFENLFTTESQRASIIRPSYLLIGKIAALTHTESVNAYQYARLFASVSFCIALYLLLREVFSSSMYRLLAFWITLTSSGFGWLIGRFVESSSDTWIPESNVFMSLAESPHFIFSQTLMILGFLWYLHFIRTKNRLYPVLTIFCCVLLAFEHPFNVLIMGPVLFFFSLFAGVALVPTILICGLCMLGILYPLIQLRLNPIFASEQAQGVSYSPAPMAYLSGLGGLIPLAIVGANKWLGDLKPARRLLLLWALIGVIALYAPVSFQRRMSEGISIPLSILASMGIITLYRLTRSYQKTIVLPLFAVLFVTLTLSSVRLIRNDFKTIGADSIQNYYYYISPGEMNGLNWIRTHADPSDVVLANWFYGNLVPGVTGRRVFIGHKAQTIDFDSKVSAINSFLLEKDDAKALKFLRENKIIYIYVGSSDSMLAYGFKPESRPYLELVFEESGARVYRVVSRIINF